MENKTETPTLYDLQTIADMVALNIGQKARLDEKFKQEYLIGNVKTDDLIAIGFEFVGLSNKCGFETPIYRFGNIEAFYIEQILHLCDVHN
jgi:hypothetical protein